MAGFGNYLTQLEQARGLPPGYLARTRQIESGGGRNLASPLSSARGDFQFIGKTAKAYGVDVNDPYSGARGAADYAADNAKLFTKSTGGTPTGADLYGMHQQGPAGYLALTRGEIPSQKALANNGGAGMSAEQFKAKLNGLFNGVKVQPGVEPGVEPGAGPTVGSAMAANAPLPGAQGPTLPLDAANPAMAAPPAPAANAGLLGVLNGEGSMGDLLKSNSFGTAAKGLMTAIGGTQAPARPAMQFAPVMDDENKPQMGLLQMLQRRKMGVA